VALFDILVNIAANTAKLESGLQQAQQKVEDFADGAERAFKRIAEVAGIGLSIDAVATSIKHAIDSGDRLQLLSDRMGTSVETLSRLQFAAALTDIPVEALTSSFDHFHQILTRAELGTGRAGKAIAAMGIDSKKLLDLPFEQQLEAIADKLSKIENPAKRAGLEMILFGAEGAKLDPLLRQGAAGIQQLEAEADKAGVTIDGKMTQSLKEAHEALVTFNAVVNAAESRLAAGLAPAIKTVAGWLATAVGSIKDLGEGLAHYFGGADTLVGQLTDKLDALTSKSIAVGTEIQKMQERSTGFLGYPGQFDSQIAHKKQQLAEIAAQIIQVNAQLAEAKKAEEAAKAAAGHRDTPDISRLDVSALTGVQVDATKIYVDKMTALLEEFDHNTEDNVEKVAGSWYKLEAELNELRAQGLISQEEYVKRLKESLDKILPSVEVTAKIKKPVEEQFTEMEKLGERAAATIQSAFANFLFNPFHNSLKRFALEFLQALQRMTADAAASKIFQSLFGVGDGGSKKGGDNGLGGILGNTLNQLFEGSPSGGGGGGTSTAGRALGAASGGFAGVFGKFISGLFSGGGGGGGGGGGLGIEGALAGGGQVSAGSTYLVGEDGPELFTAASHGMVTPNTALQDMSGGSPTFNMGGVHIDARGADADRVMTLVPPLVTQAIARSKADMLQAFRRSGLAAPVRA
jgi:hypothetical protein